MPGSTTVFVPGQGPGPITCLGGPHPQEETLIRDEAPTEQPAADLIKGGSTNLRLVRLRLFLALITMFAIPIAITTPVVYGQARGEGASLLLPTLIIIGLACGLGILTVWLAHRVLEPAEGLEQALRSLEGAYDQARSEALLDGLTGLGNHRAFQEEIERQWSSASRYSRPLALVLLDLDEFKQINDSDGHAAGDLLLRRIGGIIGSSLRRSDRAFRVGGDEFAILLPDTDDDGAYVVTRRLLASCLETDGRRSSGPAISFSAGIAAVPGSAKDRETLYSHADAALYWGKRHGRTCVTVYDRERHESAATDYKPAELSGLVARVATTGAIRAVFQPIYDLVTGAPRGFEGLVRPLPNSGFNDPGTMFAAAEATGRTTELDIACLNAVMEAASRLRLPGSLTVNLSPRTLEMDEFSIHAFLRMIVRHGLDPRRIVLELTEREAVENIDRLRSAVEACRVAGIRVAADDVGAGNAGLRLLSQLRFDIVKIDLSLVQGGSGQNQSLEIVRTLRDLADRWGALVVAEGIETPAQLEVVRSLGIGAGQGYLLGRPAEQPPTTAIDLDALIRGSNWLMDGLRAVPA
jgi:diguanylate cyclase (GGDEF)-like protein